MSRTRIVIFLCAVALLAAVTTIADPGNVLGLRKISDDHGSFNGDPDPGDWFGYSVTSMGDLNGDGRPDIAVGAPFQDDGPGDDSGAVWILFLNADGKVGSEQKISSEAGGFQGFLDPGDEFGASVARIADLDGNGVDDLAVGAPADDDGGENAGAVWILFLDSDGTVIDEAKISDVFGGLAQNLIAGDFFGLSVTSLGDFDGDGTDDLAVGAPLDDDGDGVDVGAFYVLFLNDDGTVRDEVKVSDLAGNFKGTINEGDWFGHGITLIGDLDADGTIDLAVGAPLDNDGDDADSGAIWILFMNPDGTVRAHQKISDKEGGSIDFFNLRPADLFGYDVSAPGDLNGDGIPDVVVGTPLDDDGSGADLGALRFLFLNTDGTVKGATKISRTTGGINPDIIAGDAFGSSVAMIGDLDGDGFNDVVAGAPRDNDGGGVDSGAVWVLFLEGFNESCGDATEDSTITVTDALVALNASVALTECALCLCDVDDSGVVTASDALILLSISVGLPFDLACPLCEPQQP